MKGTHIISGQDPQAVVKEAAEFMSDKRGVERHYSTTPVLMGVLPGGQANLMVFTSCLLIWECTDAEWKSYLFNQQMKLKKSVIG